MNPDFPLSALAALILTSVVQSAAGQEADSPIAEVPATLQSASDARNLFNSLFDQYIREKTARLTSIDAEYSAALTALSAENSERAVALLEKQQDDFEALGEMKLDIQERDQRASGIQQELDVARTELAEWYKAETTRLRTTHAENRGAQIDAHNALVQRLQAEQSRVLQQIDLGPIDTQALLANIGSIRRETLDTLGINGDNAVVVDLGEDDQPRTPASGIDPASRDTGIAGSVDTNAPIDEVEESRADALGEQIEQGEESQRPARFEHYIVECPPVLIEWGSEIPPQWTRSYASRNHTGKNAGTDIRVIHGYGTVMVCEYDTLHYVHQPVAPGQVCEAIDPGQFRCRQEGEYVSRSGQTRLEPSQRGSFDLGNIYDVWWGADTETAQFLEAVNGMRFRKLSSSDEPGWFDCQDALSGSTPSRYSIGTLSAGDYFCYQTGTREKYGFFRVIRYEGNAPRTLVIYFETWDSRSP